MSIFENVPEVVLNVLELLVSKNLTGIPHPAAGSIDLDDALVRPLNIAPAYDYDALVRPLNPVPADDHDALVRPLNPQEAPVNGTLAHAGDVDALFGNLLAALGEAKSVETDAIVLSEAFATSLSSVPEAVWIALVAHLESLPDAVTPVTLTEGFFDALAQFPVQQIDVEAAIQLVGIGVLDAVVL
jgi:hypothetical protein